MQVITFHQLGLKILNQLKPNVCCYLSLALDDNQLPSMALTAEEALDDTGLTSLSKTLI
ncbi:hypothetical protein O9929_23760 [Vibrio lentus]|nr:hypothetical protein [Vibrio lentus]